MTNKLLKCVGKCPIFAVAAVMTVLQSGCVTGPTRSTVVGHKKSATVEWVRGNSLWFSIGTAPAGAISDVLLIVSDSIIKGGWGVTVFPTRTVGEIVNKSSTRGDRIAGTLIVGPMIYPFAMIVSCLYSDEINFIFGNHSDAVLEDLCEKNLYGEAWDYFRRSNGIVEGEKFPEVEWRHRWSERISKKEEAYAKRMREEFVRCGGKCDYDTSRDLVVYGSTWRRDAERIASIDSLGKEGYKYILNNFCDDKAHAIALEKLSDKKLAKSILEEGKGGEELLCAAINLIEDDGLLGQVVMKSSYEAVRNAAARRAAEIGATNDTLLSTIALESCVNSAYRNWALKMLKSEDLLYATLQQISGENIESDVCKKFESQEHLAGLALYAQLKNIREDAASCLTNETEIGRVLANIEDESVANGLVGKIHDQNIARQVATNARMLSVRCQIAHMLDGVDCVEPIFDLLDHKGRMNVIGKTSNTDLLKDVVAGVSVLSKENVFGYETVLEEEKIQAVKRIPGEEVLYSVYFDKNSSASLRKEIYDCAAWNVRAKIDGKIAEIRREEEENRRKAEREEREREWREKAARKREYDAYRAELEEYTSGKAKGVRRSYLKWKYQWKD